MPAPQPRTEIGLIIASDLRVGQACELRVQLESRRPLRLRGVRVDIECVLETPLGTPRRFLLDRLTTGDEELRLPAGLSHVPVTWWIPLGLPPSLQQARYFAHVHADLPWRPDAHADFELPLAPSALPVERHASAVHFGGTDREHRIGFDGSFEWDVVRAGSRARLRVAFAAGEGRGRLRAELRATLIQRRPEQVMGSSSPLASYVFESPIANARPGRPIEIVLAVPVGAPPSFASPLASVSWRVDLRARLGWKLWQQSLPIEIVDEATAMVTTAGASTPPPAIGDSARQLRWSFAAAEQQLAFDGSRITGSVAGTAVRIERVFVDGAWWLAGELEYAPLDLDLRIRPARLFERLRGGGDPEIGAAWWDRRHQVEAAEEEQILTFLAETSAALRALEVELLDDTHARLRRLESDSDSVSWFTVEVVALAAAIARARTSIPPPRAMQHELPSWQRLAERLEDGRLSTGNMRVVGRFAGLRAQVATVWATDRQPRYTRVSLTPALPLRLPAAAAQHALLAELSHGALGASLRADELSVDLPAPLEGADVVALERLARLARLHEQLREPSGAYR